MNLRKVLQRLFAALCLLAILTPSVHAEQKVYYFSAQNTVTNYKQLKIGIDNYFQHFNDVEFQPFKDRIEFERHIKNDKDGIYLLDSQHFESIQQAYNIELRAIGIKNKKLTSQYILVANNASAELSSLNGTIASTSSESETHSLLSSITQAPLNSLVYLQVPKALDALLSVTFGISEYALVTQSVLDTMQDINPKLIGKVTVIARGHNIYNLVVASNKKSTNTGALLESLLLMDKNVAGIKSLQLLGIDGWQHISPTLAKKQGTQP